MRKGQRLGLDELMIVNPGPPDSGDVFLGEDGTLYQVHGLGLNQEEAVQGFGQFVLGEDGTVYQVQGDGLSGLAEHAEGLGEDDGSELGRFFLGEDGTLYEVIR